MEVSKKGDGGGRTENVGLVVELGVGGEGTVLLALAELLEADEDASARLLVRVEAQKVVISRDGPSRVDAELISAGAQGSKDPLRHLVRDEALG